MLQHTVCTILAFPPPLFSSYIPPPIIQRRTPFITVRYIPLTMYLYNTYLTLLLLPPSHAFSAPASPPNTTVPAPNPTTIKHTRTAVVTIIQSECKLRGPYPVTSGFAVPPPPDSVKPPPDDEPECESLSSAVVPTLSCSHATLDVLHGT